MDTKELQTRWPTVLGPWELQPISIGYINRTYKVESVSGAYILRIYQNIHAESHIELELTIMEFLQQKALSYAVPTPVLTHSGEKTAKVLLADGKTALAMLLPVIPGHHPMSDHTQEAFAAGTALGELDVVLQTYRQPEETFVAIPRYREFEQIHPLVPDPLELASTLPVSSEQQAAIQRLIADMQSTVPELYDTLPKQVIHADFSRGNTLVQDGRVTGVLDFEFANYDLRALELAVGLNEGPINEMWGTGQEWMWIDSFGKGYASKQILLLEEVEALPKLMRLRVAYFVIHFAGRYREGIDSESLTRGYVQWALIHENWNKRHAAELVRRAKSWFAL